VVKARALRQQTPERSQQRTKVKNRTGIAEIEDVEAARCRRFGQVDPKLLRQRRVQPDDGRSRVFQPLQQLIE
jgi:hypothetical protein